MAALAASAHADPDAGFNNQLHGDRIYGRRDYDAGLGKITCERRALTKQMGRVCSVVPRRGLLLARRWVLRAGLARRWVLRAGLARRWVLRAGRWVLRAGLARRVLQRGLRRVRLTLVRLARLVAGRLTLRILQPSWCAEDIHWLSGGQTEVRRGRALQRGDLLPRRPRSHLDRSPLGGYALG